MAREKKPRQPNRYQRILEHIFVSHHNEGDTRVLFARPELDAAADALGVDRVKNLGDNIYSYRHRNELPTSITGKAPPGRHWIIRGRGIGLYEFAAVRLPRIVPTPGLRVTKVPGATPEIIHDNTLGDEQALLALVRYNRLIDIFLNVTAYSLQTHWRTTAEGIGQLEVDEIYVAVDRYGAQYVIPVQAKGGTDFIGVGQPHQDLTKCEQAFPHLEARAVAAQFMADGVIAMFELARDADEIALVREQHYQLVSADEISDGERHEYATESRRSVP